MNPSSSKTGQIPLKTIPVFHGEGTLRQKTGTGNFARKNSWKGFYDLLPGMSLTGQRFRQWECATELGV